MAHIIIDDITPLESYTVGATPLTIFAVPFAFFATSDLVVSVGGATKVLSTDYVVTGTAVDAGYSSGTVTLNTAVMNTTVVISRVVPIERTTDFPNSGRLDIPALNTQFDKIIAILQQMQEAIDEVTPLTPSLVGGHLVFEMPDGSTLDLGSVLGAEGPAGAAQNFDTDAVLAATTVAGGINRISVAGNDTVGDGGDADRFYVASDVNPAPTDVVTSDVPHKRFRLLERVLRPGHFGIYPATADIRQGLTDLASEITWRGGARFEFDDCKDYTLCATPPANGSTVMNFADLNGLTIGFNGSKINIPGNFYPNQITLTTVAGSDTATVADATGLVIGQILNGPNLVALTTISNIVGTTLTLGFDALRSGTALHYYRTSINDALYFNGIVLSRCRNVVLKHPWFEHTDADFSTTLDPHSGLLGLAISEGCSDVDIVGPWKQVGGKQAIAVTRGDPWTEAKRSHDLRLSADVDYTFYGIFLERNGDDSEVRIRSNHVGRSGGCYSCSGNTFHVDSRAGDAYDDFLISTAANATDSQARTSTTGIKAYYRWRPNTTNLSKKGNLVLLTLGGLYNSVIRDVDITLDVDGSDGSLDTIPGAIFGTVASAGPPSVGLHYMENIRIGGTIRHVPGAVAANLFTDTAYTAVSRRAFRLDGLSIESATAGAVNIDGRGMGAGSVELHTIQSIHNLNQTNVTAGTLVGSNAIFANITF